MNIQQNRWITAQSVRRYCITALFSANICVSNQEVRWDAAPVVQTRSDRKGVCLISSTTLSGQRLHVRHVRSSIGVVVVVDTCYWTIVSTLRVVVEERTNVRIKNHNQTVTQLWILKQSCKPEHTRTEPSGGIFHSHKHAACMTSLMLMLTLGHRQSSPAHRSKSKAAENAPFFLTSRARKQKPSTQAKHPKLNELLRPLMVKATFLNINLSSIWAIKVFFPFGYRTSHSRKQVRWASSRTSAFTSNAVRGRGSTEEDLKSGQRVMFLYFRPRAAASEEFRGAFTHGTDERHQEMSYHHTERKQQRKPQLLKQ